MNEHEYKRGDRVRLVAAPEAEGTILGVYPAGYVTLNIVDGPRIGITSRLPAEIEPVPPTAAELVGRRITWGHGSDTYTVIAAFEHEGDEWAVIGVADSRTPLLLRRASVDVRVVDQ